jgi:hypothetical protein
MANFLNRLAARVAGAAPVAQPLVPTLFSPDSGLRGSAVAESAVEKISSSARDNNQRDVERHATLPALWESTIREKDTVQTLPARRANSIEDELDSLIERESSPLPASRIRRRQPETAGQSLESDGTSPSSLRNANHPLSEITRPASHDLSAVQTFNHRNHKGIETLRSTSAIPAERMRRSEDFAANVEPQPPIIRVTIGRIDVRAQFSTSATPPAAAAPPRRQAGLSLDEYMKQRSEGKR